MTRELKPITVCHFGRRISYLTVQWYTVYLAHWGQQLSQESKSYKFCPNVFASCNRPHQYFATQQQKTNLKSRHILRILRPNQFSQKGRTPLECLPNVQNAMHKMVHFCQLLLSHACMAGKEDTKKYVYYVWKVKSLQNVSRALLLFYKLSILVLETEKEELTNLIFECILKCAPDVTLVQHSTCSLEMFTEDLSLRKKCTVNIKSSPR